MKKKAVPKTFHTSNSQRGMGDSYGTGYKNPIGKPRDVSFAQPPKAKKLGKPPKSLA